MFEKAPGRTVQRSDVQHSHLVVLGRLLGRLHEVSVDYPRVDRLSWDIHLKRLLQRLEGDGQAHAALQRVAAACSELSRRSDTFGLVHYDVHMQNYHIDGHNLWLFDFDRSQYHWHAADIACAWYFALAWIAGDDLLQWHQSYLPTIQALLDGYRETRRVRA